MLDFIEVMRLYETTGKISGSPRDMVGDAADEIERLRAALTKISGPLTMQVGGVGIARALKIIDALQGIARAALESHRS